MFDSFHFRMLNELKIHISTTDFEIPIEWFHAIRSDDFCNMKWHSHPTIEMHCVLEGNDEFVFQEGVVSVLAGQCLVIPGKLLHKRSALQQDNLLKFSISFSILPKSENEEVKFLQSAFQCDNFKLIFLPDEAKSQMMLCLQEANMRRYGFLSSIQALLLYSLFSLARELLQNPKAGYPVETHKVINDERYKIIEKYILDNMENPIPVHEIANFMNLSTKQLGRIIVSCSDSTSVSNLILSMRIHRAKELLSQPHLSISEVAKMIGFSTEYYFNRIFKREVGLPPGRYRKSLRAL